MATLLQKAIDLAVKAHAGQEDPPGEPYIVHPLRVMLAVSQGDDDHQNELLRCVAVLHDAVERGGMRPVTLRKAGMPAPVVKAVKLLTHDNGGSYAKYVIRLKADALARAVKIADLLDNADLRHVAFRPGKETKDVPRLVRYAASYRYLTGQIGEKAYLKLMEIGEMPAS
jgi:(p)ppGpp synthase/HD superfamily hydrolase